MVIVIIGILSAVGFRSLARISTNRNFNLTIANMNKIKYAIVGNPKIVENGVRIDYGYVGDTGQFPTSLNDLLTDPGVAGWDGPYGDYTGIKEDPTALFRDGWNTTITYSVPTSGPVTLTSPGDGDPIVLKIANDKSEILNNTVALRVRNGDGYPLRDSDATVQIQYGGDPWQTMTYSKTLGYNISSVPIGIATLRFIVSGDTSLRHLSVGPNNSTTSPTEGLEYTVNPTFGTLTYVAGTASLGGTNNSELTFTVNNSGNTIMDISQISVSWSNSLCWECDYAYMANITVNGTDYWKWNTINRSALASTGARLVLDNTLSLPSGNTTIGPIAFQDQVDGNGTVQPMNDVTFRISFFSSLTPNQTVSFSTSGTCSPAVISYSNLTKPQLYRVRLRIHNTGSAATTITGMQIKCDVSPSPYLNIISFINASTIYWQANQSWCGNQSRQLVDNVNGVDITFCKTQPPAFISGGGYILLNRMDFYLNATGSTKADVTGANFTLTLHFKCGSDQTISFTMP
ncbi:MAG: hypothetical protein GXO90_11030 [FCB group bacterium]|nr:hypothetical protein [FCB group bacterium]